MSQVAHAPAAPSTPGPQGSARLLPPGGALFGTGAVIVWNDITPEGRQPFYEWHDKEHMPERLSLPGFRRGRRYVKPSHSPEWLTLYEAEDVDVMVSPAYLARLNAPTAATTRTLQYFRNTSRAVCRLACSTGTSSGGHILALRLDDAGAPGDDLPHHVRADLFPQVIGLTSVVACHLYRSDQGASHIDTAESSTRSFDVPSWVVLVESTTAAAAERAHSIVVAAGLQRLGVTLRNDAAVYALEICRLPGPA